MARGRYSQNPKVDPSHYGTYPFPVYSGGLRDVNLLEGVRTVTHTWQAGDRMDILAAKYFNDDQYWWVIALANNIGYPLGVEAGAQLLIPMDVNDVLKKLFP